MSSVAWHVRHGAGFGDALTHAQMEARDVIEELERAILIMDATLEHRVEHIDELRARIVRMRDPLERTIDDVGDEAMIAELRRRVLALEEALEGLRHLLGTVPDSSLYDPLRALRTDLVIENDQRAGGPGLVVHARRDRSPDTWSFTIDTLSVSESGFTHDEAMVRDEARARPGPEPRRY